VYRNTIGTYIHGSLLPKNPHLADYLISTALERRYGAGAAGAVTPLDDKDEWLAHTSMLRRLGVAARAPA
jgi:hypothetical protein